jgi:molecular chaperone GrpE
MITSSNKKQLVPAEENKPPAVIQEKPTPIMETGKEQEREKERKLENKRVEALENALHEERHRAEDYLNRLRCLQADFENYQKRARREVAEAATYGNEFIIKEFLNIVDDLELSIQVGKQCNAPASLIEGLTMVLNKTLKVLEKEGVSLINSLGKPFDPHLHEVVSKTVGEENQKDDLIVEEIRKGYTYKGKIIRPSMVRVAIARSPSNNNK